MEINAIHRIDCVEGMDKLPDDAVDLIIADPPYNLSKGGSWKWDNTAPLQGMGGNWSKAMERWDNLPLRDYLDFTLAWLTGARRVLRPTGSLWIFGTYHNIGLINLACQLCGTEIINEVVWYKRNAFPNLSGRRLTASHETVLWCHAGGKQRRYFFDYRYAKEASFPGDTLKAPGKQMRTVWDIPNNKERRELAHGRHPTQKPLRILERMIRLSAKPGDLLLAPFAGAGSECLAAHELGLDYIGFETEAEYVALARERLANARPPRTNWESECTP